MQKITKNWIFRTKETLYVATYYYKIGLGITPIDIFDAFYLEKMSKQLQFLKLSILTFFDPITRFQIRQADATSFA